MQEAAFLKKRKAASCISANLKSEIANPKSQNGSAAAQFVPKVGF